MNTDRKIKVDKKELISKIKENQENHKIEYYEAVIAYKKEALRQLELLTDKVNNGELSINLSLTTPINNDDKYQKHIEQFEWEIDDEVELSKNEFAIYVQDETDFSRAAKFSNTFYSNTL